MSSARLAARYPASGGTYVYGREGLGEFWGYLAGWAFVVGKTASCAAMALTVGSYMWPGQAHAIANASAWTLAPDEGRPARIVPVVGLAGCLVLAFALPASSVISGAAVLAAGAAAYAVRRAVTARRA